MKLNNTIILTLDDFRRHFNINAFWISRRHFLRDIDKEKILVPEEDEDYLEGVRKWLEAEEKGSVTDEFREKGIEHLSLLAKHNVTVDDLRKAMGVIDFTTDIIYAPQDGILNLPGEKMKKADAVAYAQKAQMKERLHKIEIEGEGKRTAIIMIGGEEVSKLKNDECVYVTEANGYYLRALSSIKYHGSTPYYLKNIHGVFESTLVVEQNTGNGFKTEEYDNVTHFRISPDFKISGNKYFVL